MEYSFLFSLFVIWTRCVAAELSLEDALALLPACASGCIGQEAQNSACSTTNRTCLCTDESFQRQTKACIVLSCNVTEALSAKNTTNTLCGVPVRDRSQQYVALSVGFGVLSALFCLQRFAFKIFIDLDFYMDDWLTLLTTICSLPALVISCSGMAGNGLGRDIWTLTHAQISDFILYFYINTLFYFWNIALLKLTLLFFYLRLFPNSRIRRLLWATIALTTVYILIYVFIVIFQCSPIPYYWTRWDGAHQGKCLNINAIGWSYSVISITLDIWMLAIPLFQLRHLMLSWRKKAAIAAMFFVGTFITIVSIIRMVWIFKFNSSSENPTWDFFVLSCWSTVEVNVGVMCVCMPSFRLMLNKMLPGLLGSTHVQDSSHTAGRSAPNNVSGFRVLTHSELVKTDGQASYGNAERRPGSSYNGSSCHGSADSFGRHEEIEIVYVRNPSRDGWLPNHFLERQGYI